MVRIGDQELHPVGIGTWDMGNSHSTTEDEACVTAVRHSLSRGQNHIDTGQQL